MASTVANTANRYGQATRSSTRTIPDANPGPSQCFATSSAITMPHRQQNRDQQTSTAFQMRVRSETLAGGGSSGDSGPS